MHRQNPVIIMLAYIQKPDLACLLLPNFATTADAALKEYIGKLLCVQAGNEVIIVLKRLC